MDFLAQGGGHGYSPTLGLIQDAMMINLHQFNQVKYNPVDQTVTVGGAANFSTVTQVLYEAGRELSTSCAGLLFQRFRSANLLQRLDLVCAWVQLAQPWEGGMVACRGSTASPWTPSKVCELFSPTAKSWTSLQPRIRIYSGL